MVSVSFMKILYLGAIQGDLTLVADSSTGVGFDKELVEILKVRRFVLGEFEGSPFEFDESAGDQATDLGMGNEIEVKGDHGGLQTNNNEYSGPSEARRH